MDIHEQLDRAHEQWEKDYEKKVASLNKLIDEARNRNDHVLTLKLQGRQAREQSIIDKKLDKFYNRYLVAVCGFTDEAEVEEWTFAIQDFSKYFGFNY